jgi:peroxiredoxin family protein/rhodanese-related sulfurtransferase/TusA-related sulfurtransferase
MHLKLLFEPEGGRILGAQAVGYDGVDKRLDVLATALRAGMTVGDLEHLELAYAPPFGSAKDPVNMAGFIASNLLRGDLALWYAEDYPERTAGAALVDVRSPQEFETWHIPGAVNVPLGELRARAGELPKDRPIRLYCAVGFRSYLAHRALRQRGFADVATLAGGTTTFRQWHREIAGPPGSERPTPPCAGERTAAAAAPAGRTVELDCTGLACPGPILRLRDAMEPMRPGDELRVRVTDSGFLSDAPAWCRAQGHELVELRAEGAEVRARIRKGSGVGPAAPAAAGARPRKKTFVVFSGDLDRVMAAFILANGARAMGDQVTLFFTFWGLNALRRETPPPVRKGALDRMFGAMMPRGAAALKLSRLHMLGMGTAMMKKVMAGKGVASLPELVASARRAGVRMVACTMTMDVMRLRREELIEGLDYAGVAAFLGEADQSSATLFI